MQKVMISLAAVVLMLCIGVSVSAEGVSAQAAILCNADTGDVLYEKAADVPLPIASVTKLMTALVVAEHCDGVEIVTVDGAAVGVEGSSLYLAEGEELSVETLLYGLLLESGNDAAAALAIHVSGSIEDFAALMNETAQSLGCTGSVFQNPHGLTQEGHYATARDLALIMAAVQEIPILREIMATERITIDDRTFENHNRLLQLYDYTTGGKTGYTMAAGRTLVTSAEKDGVRLICVTLNDGDDWNDHISLYEAGFARYRTVTVLSTDDSWQVPVISGVKQAVCVVGEYCEISLLDEEQVEIKVSLPRFVYANVEEGSTAGYLSVLVDGEERHRIWLTYGETVLQDRSILEQDTAFSRWTRKIWGALPLDR